MNERLTESLVVENVSPESSGNGSALLKLLEESYSQGTSAEECYKNFWLRHLRGEFPAEVLESTLDSFFNFLPEPLQVELTRPLVGSRDQQTPLSMIVGKAMKQFKEERREAMFQIEKERREAMVRIEKERREAIVQKRPEGWKKPSKGEAKHIRGEKAAMERAKRRSSILPKS